MLHSINHSITNFTGYTKTSPKMSESAYEKAIQNLAAKEATKGVFHSGKSEYMSLLKDYVSVASPDRRSLINYLLRNLRCCSFDDFGNIDYAELKDENGKTIGIYSQTYGWSIVGSSAENARESHFCAIYNEAWNATYNNKGNTSSASSASNSSFEATV
ncbi:hypothetical protein MAMMFC1_01546 [Methylomusa anaerophila]|uniref:Uncharacterized protein n=2 Tax=Methylomusa anaerophila TaxID=1930071 RepID=A0A348AII1_9FIRM|nr:hypothetical protein MAMMFC1_01546 [Methylomusa anaerophila]